MRCWEAVTSDKEKDAFRRRADRPHGPLLVNRPQISSEDATGGSSVFGADLQYSITLSIQPFENPSHVISLSIWLNLEMIFTL